MDISVVIPIFNEAPNIPVLHQRLKATLEQMALDYEIIFVNDGSRDGSADIIRSLAEADERVKYLSFSRNFGHQIAFYAGMVNSKGKAVVTMDGDLQDPPELLPDLCTLYHQGYDVVYAKRKTRKGVGFFKRSAYKIFYRILARITSIDIPLDTGDFRLVDRKVIKWLEQMQEQEKFLRGQIAWIGFKQTCLEYNRDARNSGTPGYTYKKLIKLAIDGITSFSNFPLRIASISGFIVSGISFLLVVRVLYVKLFTDKIIPEGYTSLLIALLFLGGIQLFSIGFIGEYIARMNSNIRKRPLFIIEDTNIHEPPR